MATSVSLLCLSEMALSGNQSRRAFQTERKLVERKSSRPPAAPGDIAQTFLVQDRCSLTWTWNMSPRRADPPLDFPGQTVSFRLMLYEMVTGKRPFQRDTAAETLVAFSAQADGCTQNRAPPLRCVGRLEVSGERADKRYVSTRELARELAAIRDASREASYARGNPPDNFLCADRVCGAREGSGRRQRALLRQDVACHGHGPGGIGTNASRGGMAGAIEMFPGGIHFVPLSPLAIRADRFRDRSTLGIRRQEVSRRSKNSKRNLQIHCAHDVFLLDNSTPDSGGAYRGGTAGRGPNLKILVTTVQRCTCTENMNFRWPPLALPDSRSVPSLDVLSQYPAVALFVPTRRRCQADFELNREKRVRPSLRFARDWMSASRDRARTARQVLSPSSLLTRLGAVAY